MKEQIITPTSKCACQNVLHKFDTLQNAVGKNEYSETASEGSEFMDALREVMAAHFENATATLIKKFDENRYDVTTGFLLAQCFRLQHRYQEMIAIYEEMGLTHTLSHLMSFELALGYLNLGLIEKALPLLEKVSAQDHYEEAVVYHLAEAYFRAGKLMSAISTLREAVPRHPNSRRLHDFLARLLEVGDP